MVVTRRVAGDASPETLLDGIQCTLLWQEPYTVFYTIDHSHQPNDTHCVVLPGCLTAKTATDRQSATLTEQSGSLFYKFVCAAPKLRH